MTRFSNIYDKQTRFASASWWMSRFGQAFEPLFGKGESGGLMLEPSCQVAYDACIDECEN
jgi:hypothetical protein